MRARVPSNIIDNSFKLFPEGAYDGDITGAVIRDPNNDDSWLLLKVSVGNITAKDGTASPGRDRFQSDITLKTDGTSVFEIEDFGGADVPFVLERGAGLLAGLAEGLGIAETRENGAAYVDLKEVVEALIDGNFEGERVGFEVAHWTSKGDKPVTRDQYVTFGFI